MHAVGRASKNAPTFINLKYNGNPDSDRWVAFVGKGVCFDTGGLNIKPSKILKYYSFWNKRYVPRQMWSSQCSHSLPTHCKIRSQN